MNADRLVVEAEVTAPADIVPAPGIVHALQVDRYRVIRVVDGEYDHETLFAAREAGTPFHVGDRLRLTLISELPAGSAPVLTEPAIVVRRGLYYVERFESLAVPIEVADPRHGHG